MPNIFFRNLQPFIKLTRFHSPTGYLLCFFPACFGLLLGVNDVDRPYYVATADLVYYVPLFLVGSMLVRSAGCIINDYFDQDFDRQVERTKDRPLANQTLTSRQALVALLILGMLCLAILFSLTKTAIIIGLLATMMISLYPLMKRITYYPQIFLGFTFNMGCLIGYSAIMDDISINALILYIICAIWTVAFDSIYAFMDLKDDKIAGVKSIAILLENYDYRLILSGLYGIFLLGFDAIFSHIIGPVKQIILLFCYLMVIYNIYSLDINSRANCLARFKRNNILGLVLFLTIL